MALGSAWRRRVPWHRAKRLSLTAEQLEANAGLPPVSPHSCMPNQKPVTKPSCRRTCWQGCCVHMRLHMSTAHFQQLYEQADDPWQVRQRWYEQRKRSLLLASLPAPRYRHI
jgi:hypothetical protein